MRVIFGPLLAKLSSALLHFFAAQRASVNYGNQTLVLKVPFCGKVITFVRAEADRPSLATRHISTLPSAAFAATFAARPVYLR
jgi:hypothetical protein